MSYEMKGAYFGVECLYKIQGNTFSLEVCTNGVEPLPSSYLENSNFGTLVQATSRKSYYMDCRSSL